MKLIYLTIVILFPSIILAQRQFTEKQIFEDYTIFKDIITTGHPALYEYTTKESWDSIFKYIEEIELKQLKNSDDLYKTLCGLADNVKDGHLIVHHPKMDTIPKMFPLMLKIIDGKLFTDTYEYEIPVGSEILSINGIKSEEIIKKMLKYAPSDGYILTKKYRQIEKEFGILHYYEFGEKNTYIIESLTPKKRTITTIVKGQEFEQIGKRYALRNSHFASYHNFSNRIEFFNKRVKEKWPYYYSIDSINTVVLTINSFGLEPKEFKSKLADIFDEIRKEKAKNLIIDIRANNGGYRINAINLYTFLTNKPFKQRIFESTITERLPKEEYIIHKMSDYAEFMETYFASAKIENGKWLLKEDHAQSEMIPNKKRFKGNIYVLIGGKTFSAGSAFALSAKNDPSITLIGEETGGGYYYHTGQFPVLYMLPNSKIMLRMSFVKIDHYVTDNSILKGCGVLPDFVAGLKVQDLIKGIDSQMEYVIKKIKD